MNKENFIKVLSEKLNYSEEKCVIINDILESTLLVGKKNKEKIIAKLQDNLDVSDATANKIYNTAIDIINSEVKEKLKHPFKSLD